MSGSDLLNPLPTTGNTSNVRQTIQTLKSHKRSGITEGIVIDLIISFLLVAILFPIAQAQIVSATTTLWNSSVITMFAVLLPILVIVAIVYHFMK